MGIVEDFVKAVNWDVVTDPNKWVMSKQQQNQIMMESVRNPMYAVEHSNSMIKSDALVGAVLGDVIKKRTGIRVPEFAIKKGLETVDNVRRYNEPGNPSGATPRGYRPYNGYRENTKKYGRRQYRKYGSVKYRSNNGKKNYKYNRQSYSRYGGNAWNGRKYSKSFRGYSKKW